MDSINIYTQKMSAIGLSKNTIEVPSILSKLDKFTLGKITEKDLTKFLQILKERIRARFAYYCNQEIL